MSQKDTGAATRAAAAQAVDAVLSGGQSLDSAAIAALSENLSARDQSFARALSFGALRWHHRHRLILDVLLDRPLRNRDRLLEALLSVGLYQLIDARQPGYASVSATVEAARILKLPRAANLVNATLRRFQREQDAVLRDVLAHDTSRYSHPQWLIDQLREDWGETAGQILTFSLARAPLWLRVNTNRTRVSAFIARLRESAGIDACPCPGIPTAVRTEKALPVNEIPGFSAGEVSVQDAASQLAASLLDPQPGMRVLDACAAPGGKTGHLLERVDGRIDLVAIDIDGDRNDRVAENLERLGYKAQILTADVQALDDWTPRLREAAQFDRILVDAPCSATGVIRRHPDIKFLRRSGDIPALATRQGHLLDALWPLLNPGGRLLYSTCSLLRAENQSVVDEFLSRRPDARLAEPPAASVPAFAVRDRGPGLHLLPGNENTDGFYYALMERVVSSG